jgi:hypothetical protein
MKSITAMHHQPSFVASQQYVYSQNHSISFLKCLYSSWGRTLMRQQSPRENQARGQRACGFGPSFLIKLVAERSRNRWPCSADPNGTWGRFFVTQRELSLSLHTCKVSHVSKDFDVLQKCSSKAIPERPCLKDLHLRRPPRSRLVPLIRCRKLSPVVAINGSKSVSSSSKFHPMEGNPSSDADVTD